ncbi:MAG: aminotransferase class I/II-fold pyridoxal phosphate-dependent enzyme [Verrucomicrobiota bacterium]
MRSFSRLRSPNSIIQRCKQDEATRARLKYDLWYRSFDREEGAYVWKDGRRYLMLSSNDYLGLSHDPRVIAAAQEATAKWGSSPTGARLANGSRSFHRQFEEQLAEHLGTEDCIVVSAGYLACMTAVSTFARKGDLILVDRNVHSALWSGITLSGAAVERFGHNDPADLQDIIVTEDRRRPKMVVLEGVYSMEGHIARLPEFGEVTRGHDCFFVLDDAHGLGVLGDRGQGTVGFLDCLPLVDVICGSLSKSLASTGGFIAGSKEVIEYLRTHSKQAIFSAAIAPSQVAAAAKALEILRTEPEHRDRLWENTRHFKRLLNRMEVDTWESESPAIPIIIGSKERAYPVWRTLLKEGFFTVLAIAPAVPPGKDLLRTAVSARHSFADLEAAAEALERALRR